MKIPFLKPKQKQASSAAQSASPAQPPFKFPLAQPEPAPSPQKDAADKTALAFLQRHGQAPEQLALQPLTDAFLEAMRAGLRGEGGLPMLPAYLTPGRQVPENTPVAVLDAGGTHLRTAVVTFQDGMPLLQQAASRPMPGSDTPETWESFLRIAADALEPLLDGVTHVGICFCYPAEVTPELDARVLSMTKEVRIAGCEGRLVCADLAAELARRGKTGLRFTLLNDTAAAMMRGMTGICNNYTNGFIGMVSGTGTNTCCAIPVRDIQTLHRPDDDALMLVNLESGSFTGVPQGDFDRALDAASDNPGAYLFEKMTGGRYLGELCRLTLAGAAEEGLFSPAVAAQLRALKTLSAPEVDLFAADPDSGAIPALCGASEADRALAVQLISAIFERAARAITANIAAILMMIGGADNRYKPLVVCVDGALFANSNLLRPAIAETMQTFLAEQHKRYCVCKAMDNATIIGTAAAALMRENG